MQCENLFELEYIFEMTVQIGWNSHIKQHSQ